MTKPLDAEIKVLRRIARALDAARDLDPKAHRRVLSWTGERAFSDRSKSWDVSNTETGRDK